MVLKILTKAYVGDNSPQQVLFTAFKVTMMMPFAYRIVSITKLVASLWDLASADNNTFINDCPPAH